MLTLCNDKPNTEKTRERKKTQMCHLNIITQNAGMHGSIIIAQCNF